MARGARKSSLAVLHFRALSSDPADAFLGGAIADAIAVRLASVPRLDVVNRGAVRRAGPATPSDVLALARALGASHLLVGSIERSGGVLRVSVQLLGEPDGVSVWEGRHEGAAADVLRAEVEMARAVAARVLTGITAAEERLLSRDTAIDALAYDHFLRAGQELLLGSPDGAERAVRHYEAAIDREPGFALAHARLALAYAELLRWRWNPPRVSIESMRVAGAAAADSALSLDGQLPDALLARARFLELTSPGAARQVDAAYRNLLARYPRNAEAHRQYGLALLSRGDREGARRELERAVALRPEWSSALADLAELHLYARRYGQACRLLNQAVVAEPGMARAYVLRAMTRLRLNEVRYAWADAETASRLGSRTWGEAVSAVVDAQARDTASARSRVASLSATLPAGSAPVSLWDARYLGIAMAAVGERGRAIDLLERTMPKDGMYWLALQDPAFDPLRREPRFRRLLERVNPGS
jgi:serine/threonine-protein kinase